MWHSCVMCFLTLKSAAIVCQQAVESWPVICIDMRALPWRVQMPHDAAITKNGWTWCSMNMSWNWICRDAPAKSACFSTQRMRRESFLVKTMSCLWQMVRAQLDDILSMTGNPHHLIPGACLSEAGGWCWAAACCCDALGGNGRSHSTWEN